MSRIPTAVILDALRDPHTPRRTRDGWIAPIDLQLATGLDARVVDRVLNELDDLEWREDHPARCRLVHRQELQMRLGEGVDSRETKSPRAAGTAEGMANDLEWRWSA